MLYEVITIRAKGPLAVIPAPYLELSREDAKTLKVNEGDMVTVKAANGEMKLKAKVANRLPQGLVFVPYHFASSGINLV